MSAGAPCSKARLPRPRRRPAARPLAATDVGLFKIDILSDDTCFYCFVLFCFAAAVGLMAFVLRSPFGRTMIALRANGRRAPFLGIPTEQPIWIFVVLFFPPSLLGPLRRTSAA